MKKKDLLEKEAKSTKYKWEFLRRNPEYIKDWEEHQGYLEKYGEEIPSSGYEAERIFEFYSKWKILSPLDPRMNWDELVDRHTGSEIQALETLFLPGPWCNPPVMTMYNSEDILKEIPETGKLDIVLNLNYSKDRLKSEFERVVDEWKELYGKVSRSRVPKRRYHFDKFGWCNKPNRRIL